MNVQEFLAAFERMRVANLGRQFERRELGLLASRNGIYFNSTMWASGLGGLFKVGKIEGKFVYSFRNTPTTEAQINDLKRSMFAYTHNNERLIAHAKDILRRFHIHHID